MRLSWYGDTGVAVFSIWQGGRCTGTFRLPVDELPRMLDTLHRGPDSAEPEGGYPAGAPGDSAYGDSAYGDTAYGDGDGAHGDDVYGDDAYGGPDAYAGDAYGGPRAPGAPGARGEYDPRDEYGPPEDFSGQGQGQYGDRGQYGPPGRDGYPPEQPGTSPEDAATGYLAGPPPSSHGAASLPPTSRAAVPASRAAAVDPISDLLMGTPSAPASGGHPVLPDPVLPDPALPDPALPGLPPPVPSHISTPPTIHPSDPLGLGYLGAEKAGYRDSEYSELSAPYEPADGGRTDPGAAAVGAPDYRVAEGRGYRAADAPDYPRGGAPDYRAGDGRDYARGDGRDYPRGSAPDYRADEGHGYRAGDAPDYRGGGTAGPAADEAVPDAYSSWTGPESGTHSDPQGWPEDYPDSEGTRHLHAPPAPRPAGPGSRGRTGA
jgi:hypothetical protein